MCGVSAGTFSGYEKRRDNSIGNKTRVISVQLDLPEVETVPFCG
jgi:hypothetical protein